MKRTVAMDMSMRSSGLVCLKQKDNELVDFKVLKTSREEYGDYHERLITDISNDVVEFIEKNNADIFVIEYLALSRKSAVADVIAGLHWGVRTRVNEEVPHALIGTITVTEWRAHTIPIEDRRAAKEKYPRDPLKHVVVNHLPYHIADTFEKYVADNKWPKNTIFDLADAYFLGVYRNSLK
jgi:hypothetical protein